MGPEQQAHLSVQISHTISHTKHKFPIVDPTTGKPIASCMSEPTKYFPYPTGVEKKDIPSFCIRTLLFVVASGSTNKSQTGTSSIGLQQLHGYNARLRSGVANC